MPVPDTTPLVIAVLTFRRPDDLAAVLPALVTQARSSTIPASVVVVDNDPEGSARAFVTAQDPTTVRYVHEPEPGIAAARSRAMTEAGASRLLVFIDDDELPTEGWLNHLLATQKHTGAAAVVGPVISEYAHPPDPWISAGNFFTRRRMPTGTVVIVAATNNLLLDLEQIRSFGLAFDRRYGLLGGEDTLFTRRLSQQGGKIVWCNEAVVVDRVPANRLTRSWVLHRAFSSGNSWSRVSLELASSTGTRVLGRISLILAGLTRIAGGSARVIQGVVGSSLTWKARGARTVARGAGMVSGAIGYVYREYRRT